MDFRLTKWRVEDVDLSKVEIEKVKNDETLFYLVCIASFVEITSELYVNNLVGKYSSKSEELGAWLSKVWEFEEMQHGRMLKAYVEHVWSDFDWNRAYRNFFEEYAKLCTQNVLKNSPALEMVERAIVETGTSTFYSFLGEITTEPVLQAIVNDIKNDEVSHYKIFKENFGVFNKEEKNGKWEILKTIIERIKEIESDDTRIAYKNIFAFREGCVFSDQDFEAYTRNVNLLMEAYYPYKMAVKMVVQLLDMGKTAERLTIPLMIYLAKRFFLK